MCLLSVVDSGGSGRATSFGVWCDDENILNKGKVIMKIIFFRL